MTAYRSSETDKYFKYYNNICDLLKFPAYQNQGMEDLKNEVFDKLIDSAAIDTQIEDCLLRSFYEILRTESNKQ